MHYRADDKTKKSQEEALSKIAKLASALTLIALSAAAAPAAGAWTPTKPIEFIATAGPGPINFIDLHPHVETALPHGVTASLDWIFQWRESLRDGVYSVPGFLIIPAGKSNARFVGHRPGTEVRWQANRHLWFQADYGIFYAGKFVKESQPGRNLNYWALWAGYKF